MIPVPENEKDLLKLALDLVSQCRVSVGMRATYYRLLNAVAETGRYDGNKSLINLLYKHLDRTAAHLFSPVELKFSIDFENPYDKETYDRGKQVGRVLGRQWERSNTDTLFGRGVFEATKYGACILKQWAQVEGWEETPAFYSKLVMPWQFGVYNESENDLSRQAAVVETCALTLPEVWRRIWHLPNARKMFDRIRANAKTGQSMSNPDSFFHEVLSANQIQTGVNGGGQTIPGGIVALNSSPNYGIMGPVVAAETVDVHEIWVQDDTDYTTILLVEPDIIIAPTHKKMNLLGVPRMQPYRLIQPNEVTNWFWGRSELVDLIEPQMLLSVWADDIRRLFGLQIDKILAFIGEDGMTDERYGQFREAGWVGMGQSGKVQDLTPTMPPESMAMLKFVIDTINTLSGFPEIMQGKGEPGVRAGVHASTLLKTASPTLRDRALLIERQCAGAADQTLTIMEAKCAQTYWTKGDNADERDKTQFKLTDLPEDWRVVVDSHSSSPIFADENTQLIMAGHAKGIVQTEYVIDNLPFPNREEAKAQNKEAAERKQKEIASLLQQFPEAGEKVAMKMITGGKR